MAVPCSPVLFVALWCALGLYAALWGYLGLSGVLWGSEVLWGSRGRRRGCRIPTRKPKTKYSLVMDAKSGEIFAFCYYEKISDCNYSTSTYQNAQSFLLLLNLFCMIIYPTILVCHKRYNIFWVVVFCFYK